MRLYLGHVAFVCPPGCESITCQFCEGGLFACSVCGAFEGATPTECPGWQMPYDLSDAVYEGLADYRGGRWLPDVCQVMYRFGGDAKRASAGECVQSDQDQYCYTHGTFHQEIPMTEVPGAAAEVPCSSCQQLTMTYIDGQVLRYRPHPTAPGLRNICPMSDQPAQVLGTPVITLTSTELGGATFVDMTYHAESRKVNLRFLNGVQVEVDLDEAPGDQPQEIVVKLGEGFLAPRMRIAVDIPQAPKFGSTDEADAWLERMAAGS